MLETLRNLEQSAQQLAPQLLIASGVGVLLGGLCLWLGGLRWARTATVFSGALAGTAGACIAGANQGAVILASSAVAFVLAVFLNKKALVLVGMGVAVVIGLFFFAGPDLADSDNFPYTDRQTDQDAEQSGSIMKSQQVVDLVKNIGNVLIKTGPVAFVVSAIAGLAVGFVGLGLPRLVAAATSAALGTGVIFLGMILLLLYKGAQPLTRICQEPFLYGLVAAAMIVFATVIELLLCPAESKKSEEEKQRKYKNGEEK